MVDKFPDVSAKFNQDYFSSEAYSGVSFKRFSQYWWSNRYYAKLVRKNGPHSGRVLEIGCGLGHLLGWLVDQYDVYGTDINPWALYEASKNVPEGIFLLLSAEDLGVFPDQTFQVVISKHVVEHLSDPESAIAEISRVLVPGGLLLLATPNTASIARSVKKDEWIGYQDPTHISLWSPDQWINTLRGNHLKPSRVYSDGLWDAPYITWLPTSIQKVLFGAPGGFQAILGWSLIPLRMGESLIVLAEKNER
ncbi:MAG: methyltransferase domain-containing protein [Anaerolineales bacterium]|nr:methyltransferase domain-containing protein [Anaerolineales bacterium]